MAEPVKTTVAKVSLPKDIFEVEVNNHELLKLAYDSFLANSRSAHANTKKRGEVSGGGIKPWKQKGTGRARFGSSRNPIWRGGGIAFGPNGSENHMKKLSTTSKRVAIRQALTLANKAKKIVILEFKTTGKTSEAIKFLTTNKLERKVLMVVDEKTPQILRATNNIQNILLIRANYLSVYHILNADKIVLSPKSVDVIKSWLAKAGK
ncbi:MAG TPA: 50S ribosomal protein L4 [Candidatus Saccharimonadales bacterium]|nr:50S ribosomal protein L4 [Candidatus Saccharimonadales bacterium]